MYVRRDRGSCWIRNVSLNLIESLSIGRNILFDKLASEEPNTNVCVQNLSLQGMNKHKSNIRP